jgi:hypothetical protein
MAIVRELWGLWQQIIYIGQVLKLAMLWKLLQKIFEVFICAKRCCQEVSGSDKQVPINKP